MPCTKSLMSLGVISLQFASATALTDFGPSRQCPLGSNSIVTVTNVERPSNAYLIGQEGTILAHNNWGTPGYWIQLDSSNSFDIKLFKCSDVEAVQPASSCNSNTNTGCPAGYTCQNMLGNVNGATTCVKNQDTCWMGPACNEKMIGVPHANNYEMISNNCYAKKSMCKAQNPQPQTGCDSSANTGCPAGYTCQNLLGNVNGATSCVKDNSKPTGCFANKGGMCVYLQQEPVLFGNDLCYTTKRQCKNSLNNGGYGSTLLGAPARKRSLRGLAATEPTATPTPATTAGTYGSSNNATSPVTIMPENSTTTPVSSYSEVFQDGGVRIVFTSDGSCTIDGVAGADSKCQEYKTKSDALTASLQKMMEENFQQPIFFA